MSVGITIVRRLEAELEARIIRCNEERVLDRLDPDFATADFIRLGVPPRPTDPAALRLWREMLPLKLDIKPPFPKTEKKEKEEKEAKKEKEEKEAKKEEKEQERSNFDFRHDMAIGVPRLTDVEGDDATPASVGAPSRGRLGSSRNWSGAAIFPNRGNRFNQVIASWTVPEVKPGNGEGPWVCSTWIGMDGLRRWMRSMPQMGTAQVVGDTAEGLPPYFAWLQWWLRGRSIQLPVVIPATIAPGKKVYCCVTRLPPDQPSLGDRHTVQFFLRVDNVGMPVVLRPPTNRLVEDDARGVPATGASAEWILERPTALKDSANENIKADNLFPLPDFGSAGAEAFAASFAPDPDPAVVASIAAEPETPAMNFRTALRLRMMEHRQEPSRMAVIAKPIEAKDGKVTVVYRS